MSEDQIERRVEKQTDRLDAQFLSGKLEQWQYDASMKALSHWAEEQYRLMARADRGAEAMSFYIQIIAPMDQVYVGPFETETAAFEHAETIAATGFDLVVMTAEQMQRNQDRYGAIPIQEPRQ